MNNDRDIKPDKGGRSTTDPRIVYGICAWWDSIGKASSKPSGLPCCPHCGSVLFELESEIVWWANVDAYVERTGDTEYRALIEWMRGKCFPNVDVARLEYRLQMFASKFTEPREPR